MVPPMGFTATWKANDDWTAAGRAPSHSFPSATGDPRALAALCGGIMRRHYAMVQAGRLLSGQEQRGGFGKISRWDKEHELRDDVFPSPRHGSTPNTRKNGRTHAGDEGREERRPVTGPRVASWFDSPNQATGSCSVTSTFLGSSPSVGRAIGRRGRKGREMICVCEANGIRKNDDRNSARRGATENAAWDK